MLLGLLLLLMFWLQALHVNLPENLDASIGIIFGFLLLAGFLLGEILARLSLPRITGYLFAGIFCGPHLLGFVDATVVEHLQLVDKLALVMIAYTAGGELKLANLRKRARGILTIVLIQSVAVFVATGGVLVLCREWIHLFQGLSLGQISALAAILALIATANSPSTTVAVIVETRARGPLTDTVLGATVIKDIVVLVCFSLLMVVAMPQFAHEESLVEVASVWQNISEVGLSLLCGAAFGGLMILYLRFVGKQTVLFVVGSAFLLMSSADTFHLDALLVAVMAGFVVSNFSRQGKSFLFGLERASGPVFIIFFCLAGASLDLSVLTLHWQTILLYIVLRTLFTWLGTGFGAFLAQEPTPVRRHAWTGFIGQAGISLGLAVLVRVNFPGPGAELANLVVGAIVINQIIGPIAFRWALIRTGEGVKA